MTKKRENFPRVGLQREEVDIKAKMLQVEVHSSSSFSKAWTNIRTIIMVGG